MGQVCENCGWRKNPNNKSDKGCIFSNPKKEKIWKYGEYNMPCENYVMDTVLREHLEKILGK